MNNIRRGSQNEALQGVAVPKRIYPDENIPEYCDQSGAQSLGRKVAEYWADPRNGGYRVRWRVEQQEFLPVTRMARWDLRTDMINGLPKDHPVNNV
jgi:hypothetical protein